MTRLGVQLTSKATLSKMQSESLQRVSGYFDVYMRVFCRHFFVSSDIPSTAWYGPMFCSNVCDFCASNLDVQEELSVVTFHSISS